MVITVVRDRTDSASITVTFDAADHNLAFSCDEHNAELLYQVKHACGKLASEELSVFSQFAALVEGNRAKALKADPDGNPETDPDL